MLSNSVMTHRNVGVLCIETVEAPEVVTSAWIDEQLVATYERTGLKAGTLSELAGIEERRWWPEGVTFDEAAAMAGRRAIEASGVDPDRIGLLVSTSVCKHHLEPSVACAVHDRLQLAPSCLNFDVGNACLAFMNGMDIAARMIERAEVDYALIVDGESSRPITEATIDRMLQPDISADQFRAEFASLTLGSGAAAMVMARRELAPEGHSYLGSVSRAATEFNRLCRGQMDQMRTDTRVLLSEGLKLASKTFSAAKIALGWVVGELDQFVIHQVSKVHTDSLVNLLGLDPEKVHAIYPEMGNIGPASVPIVLAKVMEAGKLRKGDRVALLGIGSGLNCSMAEVVW